MKRITLPKGIHIPAGIIINECPSKKRFYGEWYELIIPIGNNAVAYLQISDEGLQEMKKLEPAITVG